MSTNAFDSLDREYWERESLREHARMERAEAQTGGQAFQLPCAGTADGGLHGAEQGMTLRDYFAAKALHGIVPGFAYPDLSGAEIAKAAYTIADAMLSAREAA